MPIVKIERWRIVCAICGDTVEEYDTKEAAEDDDLTHICTSCAGEG